MHALIRATLLEGRLEAVTIGPEEAEEIASVAVWFGMGRGFLERALSICDSVVLTFLMISFVYLLSTIDSEEQRSLGYNEFFQKLSPEAQDWMARIVGGCLLRIV